MTNPLAVLLSLFVILGVIYSVITPLWEAPDERDHFSYVLYLRQKHRLPVMSEFKFGEAHQPPLYYVAGAVLTSWVDTSNLHELVRPNPNFAFEVGEQANMMIHGNAELFPYHDAALAMHLVRFLSTLLGTLTVLTTYLLAREIVPESRSFALGAAAINAFIPQFIFINSVINNDSLLIALSSLCFWQMVKIIKSKEVPRVAFLWLGLFLGLSLMTKQNTLVLLPLATLAILMGAFKTRDFARFAKWGGATFLLTLALVLWWYIRNHFLYGDPLGFTAFHVTRVPEAGMVFDNWGTMKLFLGTMHASFWARFGWMNVEVDPLIIQALKLPYLAAAAGLALLPRRRSYSSEDQPRLQLIGFLLLSIIAFFIWLMGYCMRFGGSGLQGRFLFPAISAISILLALGLANLLPKRLAFVPLAIFITSLALLAFLSPFLYIAPAYPRQILPPSAVERIEHPLDYTFSDSIELLGYDIEVNQKEAAVTLGLYWRATGTPKEDYTVFTHLIGPDGDLHGQHDGYPQDGAFPTTLWRKGDIVRDMHRLPIEPSAPSGNYRIRVGLYLLSTMQRLPIVKEGTALGDYVETEEIALYSP